MKKINKKGFTLIEIIVVLVIIGILAATAIPTYNGFVENARAKQYAPEARIGLTAAQVVVNEYYYSNGADKSDSDLSKYVLSSTRFDELTDGLSSTIPDAAGEYKNGFSQIIIQRNDGIPKVAGIFYEIIIGSSRYEIKLIAGQTIEIKKLTIK